jgi:hypothetical protein
MLSLSHSLTHAHTAGGPREVITALMEHSALELLGGEAVVGKRKKYAGTCDAWLK